MSEILRLFPNLRKLAFMIEWELRGDLRHETLNRIGFYGGETLFDFGSNVLPPIWLRSKKHLPHVVSSSIANVTALTKSNFPRLSTVQLLSPEELQYFLYFGRHNSFERVRVRNMVGMAKTV